MLVTVAALLAVKNLALDNPMVPGDEYVYLSAAQTFPDSGERFATDPYLPRTYSPLFAAYGRAVLSVIDRPAAAITSLNAVAFVVAMAFFLALIRRISGVDPSILAAAVLLCFPFSSYTAYFMPETAYFLLFALLTWTTVAYVPRSLIRGTTLAGVLVGSMLLVKPHAIAMFIAVLLTLGIRGISPVSFRPAVRSVLGSLLLFIVSVYVTLVGLNGVLTGTWMLHPLMFVGGLYRPNVAQGVSLSSWGGYQFLSILAGHLIVFGALVAPAVMVAARQLRHLYSLGPRSEVHDQARNHMLFALIAFSAFAAVCTIAMTANFETQVATLAPGETYVRLHGRYYSFVIPLYIALYFAVPVGGGEIPASRVWTRMAALGACVAAGLLVYVVRASVIYPFDYPEAFVFSTWHGRPRVGVMRLAVTALPYMAIGAVLLTHVLMAWRARLARVVYPMLLIGLASASHVGVFAWQRASSLQHAALHADARELRRLIPNSVRDQGLIVGPEWNAVLAHFLFNFNSSARVLVRPPGSLLARSDISPHTGWVILVGDYTPVFPSTPWLKTPRVTCLRVPRR